MTMCQYFHLPASFIIIPLVEFIYAFLLRDVTDRLLGTTWQRLWSCFQSSIVNRKYQEWSERLCIYFVDAISVNRTRNALAVVPLEWLLSFATGMSSHRRTLSDLQETGLDELFVSCCDVAAR